MTMSGGGSGVGKKPGTETFLMQMLRCKSAFRGWGKMPFYTIMVGVWGVPMRAIVTVESAHESYCHSPPHSIAL